MGDRELLRDGTTPVKDAHRMVLLGLLFVFLLLLVPICAHGQEGTRKYWPTPVDTMWVGRQKHTHAVVTGRVVYCVKEEDGDRHIKLASLSDSTKYIIAEIIPPYIPSMCMESRGLIQNTDGERSIL
jgi:hypothetical protein